MASAKLYRRDDVADKNNSQCAWIVIHNSVYNVTEFLNEHPGGEEVLLEQAGKDGTEAFEDVGHSTDAREMMKKYKIGDLVEEDRIETQEKKLNWQPDSDDKNPSAWKSWLVPVALGIAATNLISVLLPRIRPVSVTSQEIKNKRTHKLFPIIR